MNNQEILTNAPDGATHFDGSYYYIVNEDAHKSSEIWNVVSPYKWHESGNLRLNDLIDMRSLVDIKRIAELEANQAKRDLEMQAKGLTDYAKTQEQGITAVWMISAASKLRKQAGDL
jgi:hypothetical protein